MSEFGARLILAALTGLFIAACSISPHAKPDQAKPDVVAYRMSPVQRADGQIEALKVELSFKGDADGSTLIRLPKSYAGHGQLWKNLDGFSATGGVVRETGTPDERMIEAPPSAPIVLSYLVYSGIDHEPTTNDEQPYSPWIFGSWFFADGEAVFARPDRPATTRVTFQWTGPSDLVFASDLESLPALGAGANLNAIVQSTLIGGRDLRILKSGSTRLAMRGSFTTPDAQLLASVADIITLERRFWGDRADAPYLVALGPVSPEGVMRAGLGGSGQGDAFSAAMSADIPLPRLLILFSHEAFHTWNPGQLGTARPEAWFSEGFTEYYSRVLLLRAGLLSLDAFADGWNQMLLEYSLSPARARTDAEITRTFWDDADSQRMQYLRGAFLAAGWDRRLRDASGGKTSLDDVLRKQRIRAAASKDASPATLLAQEASAAHLDIAPDIATHIDRGEPFVLPEHLFGPCLALEQVAIPTFDRGFDAEATATAGMVAAGVRTGGPAWQAGLRDGMRLVRQVDGRFGDSTRDYVWVVQAPGRPEQTLRWKPAGAGTTAIQRLRRTGAGDDAVSCGLG